MRFNLRLAAAAAALTGAMALATLFYYYSIEKDFTSGYKEVIASYNHLQNTQERISYGVLQSSLFAYYNQDPIAADRQEMAHDIETLATLPLLQKPYYAENRADAAALGKEVKTYLMLVEEYLMINAGIKNSNVFLSNQETRGLKFFPPASETQTRLQRIIGTLTLAKKMLDAAYLETIQNDVKALRNTSYSPEQKRFVNNILIHVQFVINQYPQYLDLFYNIINTPLRQSIEDQKHAFTERAREDLVYINNIASVLFISIVMAIIAIMSLLFILSRENRTLKELQERLSHTLDHDTLTGLRNRYSYEMRLQKLQAPSILMINIAKFKFFNDVYGTDTGDFILQQVARVIQHTLQQDPRADSCYRISGDEYAILFENADPKQILHIAQMVDEAIQKERFEVKGIMLHLSVNMAISSALPLLETADMAMKHLKSNPKVNLLVYAEDLDMKEQIRSNIEMTQLLRAALLDDRIIPYFQPIMDLQSREIVKYEALVRLERSNGEILSPSEFLPVAMDTPLYYQITRTMFNKSMEYFADKPYRFSVNIGMHDLEDDSIVTLILGQLSSHSEVASRLDIELLESAHLSNPAKVVEFIRDVKKYGCRIAIDDFGSGYSNFAYLTQFDIDIIKIDGSLIREIATNSEHYKTVKSIMSLVEEMGIESVAEFVQDEKSAELLREMGVRQAQGFYFGKPMPEIILH